MPDIPAANGGRGFKFQVDLPQNGLVHILPGFQICWDVGVTLLRRVSSRCLHCGPFGALQPSWHRPQKSLLLPDATGVPGWAAPRGGRHGESRGGVLYWGAHKSALAGLVEEHYPFHSPPQPPPQPTDSPCTLKSCSDKGPLSGGYGPTFWLVKSLVKGNFHSQKSAGKNPGHVRQIQTRLALLGLSWPQPDVRGWGGERPWGEQLVGSHSLEWLSQLPTVAFQHGGRRASAASPRLPPPLRLSPSLMPSCPEAALDPSSSAISMGWCRSRRYTGQGSRAKVHPAERVVMIKVCSAQDGCVCTSRCGLRRAAAVFCWS